MRLIAHEMIDLVSENPALSDIMMMMMMSDFETKYPTSSIPKRDMNLSMPMTYNIIRIGSKLNYSELI